MRLAACAKRSVAKTNHGEILSYGRRPGQTGLVAKVISYDVTVGQGYAFGDANYWQCRLNLADWMISDPYYRTGILPPSGSYQLSWSRSGDGRAEVLTIVKGLRLGNPNQKFDRIWPRNELTIGFRTPTNACS
jgi:hypothetical protein